MNNIATVFAKGYIAGPADTDHGVHLNWLAPRFGMDNVFTEANASASSEAANHPVTKALSRATFDQWRPTGNTSEWIAAEFDSQIINYVALARYQFGGADVTVQYKSGTDWISMTTGEGGLELDFANDEYYIYDPHPDSGEVIIFEFQGIQISGIRLLIENGTAPARIGVIYAGRALVPDMGLSRNWAMPSLNSDARYTTPINEEGAFLGRNKLSRTSEVRFTLDPVKYEWSTDRWRPFISDALEFPFFMWWKTRNRSESIYCVERSHGGNFRGASDVTVNLVARVVAQDE